MKRTRPSRPRRTFDARPDILDFRDLVYEPALCEVPTHVPLEDYRRWGVPVLDQGSEGACTGFGLATVAHYLLRRRRVVPDDGAVSTRMFYEMAKRYDEWAGESYEGSSARGAMKGWHKHGVCREELWPYRSGKPDRRLTPERMADALERPLGAYYRVDHRDLVALHCAIAEVGVLYATALVHSGWEQVGTNGVIPLREDILGGHAFAIVAYDARGFWIHNSWGEAWGRGGFALMTYEDWSAHGADVWVARVGVPVSGGAGAPSGVPFYGGALPGVGRQDPAELAGLRSHVLSLGHDGSPRSTGVCGNREEEIALLLRETLPAVTRKWRKKRILLYAHGGLVSEEAALARVAAVRRTLLDHEVYPLAIIWHSDLRTTLEGLLREALRRRTEGVLDQTGTFLLERLDDAVEVLVRLLGGRLLWSRMKSNALRATTCKRGGLRIALEHLAGLAGEDPGIELHLLAHSAGSILLAPAVELLTSRGRIGKGLLRGRRGLGLEVATCTFWAPACTLELFRTTCLPAIREGTVRRFGLFSLTDEAERADRCAGIYGKSLLYLVSNALEERPRVPLGERGTPLLGLSRDVGESRELEKLFAGERAGWVLAPNVARSGSPGASSAVRHGDFDDDEATLRSTLARITGKEVVEEGPLSPPAAASTREMRRRLCRLEAQGVLPPGV